MKVADAAAGHAQPLVVKVGGSLVGSGRLAPVLDAIASSRRSVIVVPGGGPFADAVRAAQAAHPIPDADAHRMALLAMHQTAIMLSAMVPRLAPAETFEDLSRTLAAGKVPVWQPLRLVAGDPDVPADWTATSDGLAAWLAGRLGRIPVVLVKSTKVPPGASASALARDGIVDPLFARLVERWRLDWRIMGPDEEEPLRAVLSVAAQGAAPIA